RVLLDLGETEAAEHAFRRVLELDPENRVALRELGQLAKTMGRLEEAVGHFRSLLLLDPGDDEVESLARDAESALRGGGEGESRDEGEKAGEAEVRADADA